MAPTLFEFLATERLWVVQDFLKDQWYFHGLKKQGTLLATMSLCVYIYICVNIDKYIHIYIYICIYLLKD